jgi:hypothetical protein
LLLVAATYLQTDVPVRYFSAKSAGEFLKRSWERDSHPYDKSTPPWTQLKPLIADDRLFYIEPAPGKPNSQHVTLDLLDLLLKFPSIARRSSNGGMLQVLALSSLPVP